MSHLRGAGLIFRRAAAADAEAISQLYAEAYRPKDSRDPRECYPFPQFLDPTSVACLVSSDTIRWFVAEAGRTVVGTVGAVVNVGTQKDRVAECFGLVVDERSRFHEIGSNLFCRLCESLTETEEALFLIAETRTAHAGGWKVVRRAGFTPLGFEPYAHKTPSGAESMLLTGKVLPSALCRRRINHTTSSDVRRLSEPICQGLGEPCYAASEPAALLTHLRAYSGFTVEESSGVTEVEAGLHSAVVGLRRLEGKDLLGRRYRSRCFAERRDGRVVASARTVWDAFDARLRVVNLTVGEGGSEGALVKHIALDLARAQEHSPCSMVVDVLAEAIALHSELQELGFFPSVYYPALICVGTNRCDAVQFTRLYDFGLEEAQRAASFPEWPWADAVAARINILQPEAAL